MLLPEKGENELLSNGPQVSVKMKKFQRSAARCCICSQQQLSYTLTVVKRVELMLCSFYIFLSKLCEIGDTVSIIFRKYNLLCDLSILFSILFGHMKISSSRAKYRISLKELRRGGPWRMGLGLINSRMGTMVFYLKPSVVFF